MGENNTVSEMKDEDMKEEIENGEKTMPPILAPLAFTGPGAVGLLGTFRRWKADVV